MANVEKREGMSEEDKSVTITTTDQRNAVVSGQRNCRGSVTVCKEGEERSLEVPERAQGTQTETRENRKKEIDRVELTFEKEEQVPSGSGEAVLYASVGGHPNVSITPQDGKKVQHCNIVQCTLTRSDHTQTDVNKAKQHVEGIVKIELIEKDNERTIRLNCTNSEGTYSEIYSSKVNSEPEPSGHPHSVLTEIQQDHSHGVLNEIKEARPNIVLTEKPESQQLAEQIEGIDASSCDIKLSGINIKKELNGEEEVAASYNDQRPAINEEKHSNSNLLSHCKIEACDSFIEQTDSYDGEKTVEKQASHCIVDPGVLDTTSVNVTEGNEVNQLNKAHKTPELSPVEEYKRRHNIGSRASTENVITYKESSFLLSSPDSVYSSYSSPSKSPTKSIEKQKFYDSGIDSDFSVSCGKKAIVHMGERVSIVGLTVKVKDKNKNKTMGKKKKVENIPLPSRRVKREASLNASAMVNIMFEKEKPLPKSPKKKTPDAKKPSSEFNFDKDTVCAKKSKLVNMLKEDKIKATKKSTKIGQLKRDKAKKSVKDSARRKMLKLKAILKKSKELQKLEKKKKKQEKERKLKNAKVIKRKNSKDIKSKKRKSEDISDNVVKVKKPRTDTRRAARTHAQVTRKERRLSGSKCASCMQPLAVQQQSSAFWTNQEGETAKSRNNSETDESKSQLNRDLTNINNPYNISRMQQMEGSLPMMQHIDGSIPRMQQMDNATYVLPHVGNVSYCHQCAPHSSTMLTATPCQAYTLSGVGSPMPLMQYQTYRAGYPLSYSASPHCPCSACYQATSVYYPQSSSLLQPQALTHDPCMRPLNMSTQVIEEKEDEIIDVGEAEKFPRSQRMRTLTEKERERRENFEKKKNSDDFQTELMIQIPKSHVKEGKPSSEKKNLKEKEQKNIKRPKSLNVKTPPPTITKGLKSPILKTKNSPSASNAKSLLSPKSPITKQQKASSLKSPKSPKVKPPLPSPTSMRKTSSSEKGTKSVKINDQKKSPNQKNNELKVKYRRSVSRHGWTLHGAAEKRKLVSQSLGTIAEMECYPELRHTDGDIIQVRDCVLLRSGPSASDIPYVAKVTAFWQHPYDGEVMMSLLWFYHPEHTEGGRKPHHAHCELFASKHKDENSVACIDDKGYVLTYNEFCRYKAERKRLLDSSSYRTKVVPPLESGYVRQSKLPPSYVDDNNVFICRQVYDFKLKRVLKNPS